MATSLDHLTAAELRLHGEALRGLGRSLLASDADDLMQDGWLAALEAPPPRHLRGWFAGTLRHLAAARRRREVRRQQRERLAARPEALPSAAETAAAAEVARRIAAAVEELHEPYRTAIVLRFWHGLEPGQLGARLGVPANTARSRVQRAIELLRARLSRETGGRAAWAGPLSAMLECGPGALVAPSAAASLPVLLAMKTKVLVGVVVLGLLACCWLLSGAQPQQVVTGPETAVVTAAAASGGTISDMVPLATMDRTVASDPGRTAVTVQVVDERDVPVPGMLVDAILEDRVPGPRILAWTDQDGIARLSVPNGTHLVIADPGWPKFRPDLHSPTAKVQATGEPIEVRLVLERFSCSVQVLVVDDLGAPLEGVEIVRRENTAGSTPSELRTDASGAVLFQGLPPGTRTFALNTGSWRNGAVAVPEDPRQSCTVGRDGFGQLEYRLPRLAWVRFVVDGAKGAEVGFRLHIAAGRWQYPSSNLRTIGGEARTRLPPGKFTIADPHVDAATPVLVRGGLSFEVAAGEPCLVLIPVEAAAGIVSVTVVDEHGQPFDRAHVSAHGLPPAQWMKFVPNATAANGKYVLQGIPDEPLMLCIDPRGVPERNLAFFGATNRKPYLELAGPTSGLVVVVNDAYTIRGRAVDAQDQALGGVVLLGTDGGLWHEQVELGRDYQGAPTAPGTFEFRHLRPGKYPLWIGSTEAGPPDAEVEVGPGVTPSHTAEVVLRQRAAPK